MRNIKKIILKKFRNRINFKRNQSQKLVTKKDLEKHKCDNISDYCYKHKVWVKCTACWYVFDDALIDVDIWWILKTYRPNINHVKASRFINKDICPKCLHTSVS